MALCCCVAVLKCRALLEASVAESMNVAVFQAAEPSVSGVLIVSVLRSVL